MNLTELQQEVYTITARPDLVNESLTAIKQATLKAHQSDFYSKDLEETGIFFPSAEYIQQLESKTLFPRWRKIKYLRKYDGLNASVGDFLEIITPEQVLDSYRVARTDIAYEAGLYLNINSSTQVKYYLIGYYAHPDITVNNYNSWIAVDYPYVIITEACAILFKMIGLDEQAALYKQQMLEQLTILQHSELAITGY